MNGEILDELVYICLKRLCYRCDELFCIEICHPTDQKKGFRSYIYGLNCLQDHDLSPLLSCELFNHSIYHHEKHGGCGATICFGQKSSTYFILSWISTLPSTCFTQIQTFLHQPTQNHGKNTSLDEERISSPR